MSGKTKWYDLCVATDVDRNGHELKYVSVEPWAVTARRVYLYHMQPHEDSDPAWARRYLRKLRDDGCITEEHYRLIRKEGGI